MKKYFVAPLIFVAIFIAACSTYGKEKTFAGVEVYYTPSVTEGQVETIGNYLISSKFADGSAKTVQLNKVGDTYQFRMVVKDGVDKDASYEETIKQYGAELSEKGFAGAPVEIHLCDDHLKTLKIVPMGTGN